MTTYTNSCAIIPFPCTVGENYFDPCDCSSYLQCVQPNSIIKRPCPAGTAWDQVSGNCVRTATLTKRQRRCQRDKPWKRCENVTNHQNINLLKRMCLGDSDNDSDDNDNDDNDDVVDGGDTGSGGGSGGVGGISSGGDDGGGDTAAVVGAVVGCLLAVAVIGIIVFFVIKKKSLPSIFKKRRHSYKTNTTPDIRHTHQQHEEEEVYDVIDESAVIPGYHVNYGYYGKQSGQDDNNMYINSAVINSQSDASNQPNGMPNQDYLTLTPDGNNLDVSLDDNLSRSISVNGREVPVQDDQGYFIGYPSGSVPRQPSPLPPEASQVADDVYSLGKAPGMLEPGDQNTGRLSPKYFVLQKASQWQNT